jgi:general nucleoside transport system ATP-binding protein
MNPATAQLEARNIVKQFGALKANDDVSLKVMPGEIHAFLGENGAGKSTLVKMIYGALQPTSGSFFWAGQKVAIENPAQARKLGIGMVFQHFSLFEALTVAENIALALEGVFDLTALSKRIAEVSKNYGLPVDPAAVVGDLSVGERQRIEILRCLLQNPKLLIMDEPTSVLTPQEADQLFVVLKRLALEGCAILYISHRLDEVKNLCSAATILRHGKVVASVDPRLETASSLARLMVGAEVQAVRHSKVFMRGRERLVLKDLALPGDGAFGVALSAISLSVHASEVVAIAGVAGNGQGELFDALSGERLLATAAMLVADGINSGQLSITQRRKAGMAFVAEERLGHGAVPTLQLSHNMVLTRHADSSEISKRGLIDLAQAEQAKERIVETYDVRKSKANPEARALSGGNLQKFVMGRELDRKPGILIVNQPTWGVDAGAAAAIRQALVDLARSGSAVLIISQDLDEIFEVADRIAVMSRGRLSTAHPTAEMTRESIGLLMAGVHECQDHAA